MYTDPYLYNREPGVRTCFPQDHPKSIISDQDFLNEEALAVLHDTMMQSNRGDCHSPRDELQSAVHLEGYSVECVQPKVDVFPLN